MNAQTVEVSEDSMLEQIARGRHDVGCPKCGEPLQRKTGDMHHCKYCNESFALRLGKRDPRREPQPGDVLRNGSEQREVVDLRGGRVEYGFPNRAATRWLSLFEWQRWARNADVVKAGL